MGDRERPLKGQPDVGKESHEDRSRHTKPRENDQPIAPPPEPKSGEEHPSPEEVAEEREWVHKL